MPSLPREEFKLLLNGLTPWPSVGEELLIFLNYFFISNLVVVLLGSLETILTNNELVVVFSSVSMTFLMHANDKLVFTVDLTLLVS